MDESAQATSVARAYASIPPSPTTADILKVLALVYENGYRDGFGQGVVTGQSHMGNIIGLVLGS